MTERTPLLNLSLVFGPAASLRRLLPRLLSFRLNSFINIIVVHLSITSTSTSVVVVVHCCCSSFFFSSFTTKFIH